MARYDVRAAALATGIAEERLSSLLTRFRVTGATGGTRGKRRTLSREAVLCLAISCALSDEIGLPAEQALALVHQLLRSPAAERRGVAGPWLLRVDLAAWRTSLASALDAAVARAVIPRRGRPPKSI